MKRANSNCAVSSAKDPPSHAISREKESGCQMPLDGPVQESTCLGPTSARAGAAEFETKPTLPLVPCAKRGRPSSVC